MQTKPISLAWVIDDDPLHALVLNRLLSSSQSVQSNRFFSGSKAAMEALTESKNNRQLIPDVIFLDMIMSKGDGWEFLEFFKKNKSKYSLHSKIVVVSAIDAADAEKIRNYDVSDFFTKPIDRKKFDEVIDRIVSMISPSQS